MLYFWWGCWGNLKLITRLGSERVSFQTYWRGRIRPHGMRVTIGHDMKPSGLLLSQSIWPLCNRFTPKSGLFHTLIPAASIRNITPHGLKNLAFHSLLRKVCLYCTTSTHNLAHTFLSVGRMYVLNLRVKGLNVSHRNVSHHYTVPSPLSHAMIHFASYLFVVSQAPPKRNLDVYVHSFRGHESGGRLRIVYIRSHVYAQTIRKR